MLTPAGSSSQSRDRIHISARRPEIVELLKTGAPHGKLMLTLLGGLAEFERELIRARTDDGRKRAKARAVKFGRPPEANCTPTARTCSAACGRRCARSYGVSQATISRLAAPSPFGVAPVGAQG
jgi:DNA invertase Pin-like site-specific DNA recombinase